MNPIDDWRPKPDEILRDVIINTYFSPLSDYALTEIERVGGPGADDPYWKREQNDDGRYLPGEAISWIVHHPDFEKLSKPKEPDPRAKYFQRSWPYRQ